MGKFEFDAKKQDAAIKSIEDMCYHCDKHVDDCPVHVALGELKQEYGEKNKRPEVNYKDFDFDSKKVKIALKTVESMCWNCKEHTDECPITKVGEILKHYVE